jgi:hypothetical protein
MTLPPGTPWALADLAREWGLSVDAIEIAGAMSGLRIMELVIDMETNRGVRAVLHEEKLRYEAENAPGKRRFPEGRFNPSDKRSHQHLITQLLSMYYGAGGIPGKPYTIAGEVEQHTAATGLQNPISKETAAKVIRDSLALVGIPSDSE